MTRSREDTSLHAHCCLRGEKSKRSSKLNKLYQSSLTSISVSNARREEGSIVTLFCVHVDAVRLISQPSLSQNWNGWSMDSGIKGNWKYCANKKKLSHLKIKGRLKVVSESQHRNVGIRRDLLISTAKALHIFSWRDESELLSPYFPPQCQSCTVLSSLTEKILPAVKGFSRCIFTICVPPQRCLRCLLVGTGWALSWCQFGSVWVLRSRV